MLSSIYLKLHNCLSIPEIINTLHLAKTKNVIWFSIYFNISISLFLSIYLFIYLSSIVSIYIVSIYLSIYLYFYLSTYRSIYPSLYHIAMAEISELFLDIRCIDCTSFLVDAASLTRHEDIFLNADFEEPVGGALNWRGWSATVERYEGDAYTGQYSYKVSNT